MNLYARILLFIICCCVTTITFAQKSGLWSVQFNLQELTAFSTFSEPVEKIEQTLEEEQNNQSTLKAFIYAVGIETTISPATAGQWDTIPSIGYVWRIGIKAENALSLNIFIEDYKMYPGMTLYVYTPLMDNVAGPFCEKNNANGGVLPVQSLPGNIIIVEWNIPMKATTRYDFTIKSIGYGFRNTGGGGKVPFSTAANCNIDINCLTGNHWQREIRSVVRLQTRLSDGRSQLCTGTLVNQAVDVNKKKPYILTANHCISTTEQAQSTTFVFGYEKPFCGGPNILLPTGITGSNLIATKRELDFTLLELHNDIDDSFNPFYAGWNASRYTPRSAVGIHHPQGDHKKISVANETLSSGTFADPSSGLFCDANAHWIVRRWREGVTEQGSSGSAIFDSEHKIVGTLSGGAATCSNPVNDYYSKFSEQWNKYSNENESLKKWLDPENKGVTSIWGYDPIAPYEGSYEKRGNIGENESKTLLKSEGWGYFTGQNDKNQLSFAERIKNDSIAIIIGIEAHLAKVADMGSHVQFAVWQGNDFPVEPPLILKNILPSQLTSNYENYPMHVFFDKALEVNGDFFIGYRLDYNTDIDTFAVYHSSIRKYPGISGMYVEEWDGTWKAMFEDFVPPVYTSLGIKAIGKFGKQKLIHLPQTQKDLKISYQQGNGKLAVYFDDFDETLTSLNFEIYDTSGKRVLAINKLEKRMIMLGETLYMYIEIDVSRFAPGVYLIQTLDNNKKQTGKFIKML